MSHLKLHIPGPIEVSEKTFEAFRTPMIGHRSQDFKDLYAAVMPHLQSLLYTERLVYLGTASAWGIMEGALRNLVSKGVLNCMKGAFSDKWFDVSKRCGKEAEALQVDWGSPILPEQIDERLATGKFDAVTLVHNETSTGVMSPLYEIAQLKEKYPDVMFIVDSVTSMTGVKIEFDNLGRRVRQTHHHDPAERKFNFDIFLCDLDGGGLEQVTHFDGPPGKKFDGFPMFSRDGKYLAFSSNRGAGKPGDTDVFIAEWAP